MEKEVFDKIVQEYKDIKQITQGDFSEIIELEKSPIVQRYLHLLQIKNSKYEFRNDSTIMGYILDKYGRNNIEKTNEIWFLLYEVPAKTYKKWNQKSQLEIDDDKIVLVYKDIENSSKTIFINKDEQEEFEMTHTIIEGNLKINDPIDRYYNARHEFFNLCINEGQEVAVQRTLLKYSEK